MAANTTYNLCRNEFKTAQYNSPSPEHPVSLRRVQMASASSLELSPRSRARPSRLSREGRPSIFIKGLELNTMQPSMSFDDEFKPGMHCISNAPRPSRRGSTRYKETSPKKQENTTTQGMTAKKTGKGHGKLVDQKSTKKSRKQKSSSATDEKQISVASVKRKQPSEKIQSKKETKVSRNNRQELGSIREEIAMSDPSRRYRSRLLTNCLVHV